jgi:hypothetical protein
MKERALTEENGVNPRILGKTLPVAPIKEF